VTVSSVTPILNVSNVRESVVWFEQLGWEGGLVWTEEGDDTPGFAQVTCGGAEVFLYRDGQGSRDARPSAFPGDESTGGVWMAWFLDRVEDVEVMHALAVRLGLDVTMPPVDEPWGVREFHLRHPDGHTFRVGHRGEVT
jgi:uncharacterized glyoxalase superfamily protein PhnB